MVCCDADPHCLPQPLEIYVDDEKKLTLHGLQQHYVRLEESAKNRKLNDLLDSLEFNQVCIFVKSVSRATQLDALLRECNFPSIAIHSGLPQAERISRYQQFKAFEKRVLVATDIFGRGIDVERVNIVINYDTPGDADSYLHRVGRAGRFGTKGLAITFVSDEGNEEVLKAIQARFEVQIEELPATIEPSTYSESCFIRDRDQGPVLTWLGFVSDSERISVASTSRVCAPFDHKSFIPRVSCISSTCSLPCSWLASPS